MPTPSPNINLILTKTELPQQLVAIANHLRRVGVGALLVSIAVGLFFAVGLAVVNLRISSLAKEKEELTNSIKSNQRKESMYAVIITQSAVAQKVLASVKPWGAVIGDAATIAPDTMLSTLSVNEKQELTMTIQTMSVDEAAQVVFQINELTTNKKIRNAVLDSLEVGNDGKVRLVITYTPTL